MNSHHPHQEANVTNWIHDFVVRMQRKRRKFILYAENSWVGWKRKNKTNIVGTETHTFSVSNLVEIWVHENPARRRYKVRTFLSIPYSKCWQIYIFGAICVERACCMEYNVTSRWLWYAVCFRTRTISRKYMIFFFFLSCGMMDGLGKHLWFIWHICIRPYQIEEGIKWTINLKVRIQLFLPLPVVVALNFAPCDCWQLNARVLFLHHVSTHRLPE